MNTLALRRYRSELTRLINLTRRSEDGCIGKTGLTTWTKNARKRDEQLILVEQLSRKLFWTPPITPKEKSKPIGSSLPW